MNHMKSNIKSNQKDRVYEFLISYERKSLKYARKKKKKKQHKTSKFLFPKFQLLQEESVTVPFLMHCYTVSNEFTGITIAIWHYQE